MSFASRTRTIPASTGTYSHLCASMPTLSARPIGGELRAKFLGEHRGRAVATVDVHPDAVLRAAVGDRIERVDRARVDGARVRDHGDGERACRDVRAKHRVERVGAHAQRVIRWDDANLRAAESEQLDRLLMTRVRLGALVHEHAHGFSARVTMCAPFARMSQPMRLAAACRATASPVIAAAELPLTSSPMLSGGKPKIDLNHWMTSRSTHTAAWLPPATLGFIAAASACAYTPMAAGGEFTHAENRGCPFPNG